MEDLFNTILISLVNNSWVYGGIIFTTIITIYLSYLMDRKLQGKYTILGFLSIILFLMLLFYFLYRRQINYKDESGDPPLNIFTDEGEKIKQKMGLPIYYFFSKVAKVLGTGAIIILLASLSLWAFERFTILQNMWNILLLGFLSITTLSIVYIFFKDQIDGIINNKTEELNFLQKILKFLTELVFLLPCLLTLFIDTIQFQVKSTVPIVWTLLLIEIGIVVAFFLIPFLFSRINAHDVRELLRGPVYLNRLHNLGSYQNVKKYDLFKQDIEHYKEALFKDATYYTNNLNIDISGAGDAIIEEAGAAIGEKETPMFNIKTDFTINNTKGQKFNYTYNYGVSFFVYLNPQPINTSPAYVKDTVIFDYASKPKLVYNGIDRELKFIVENNHNLEQTIYTTREFDLQKWFHVVINYNSGTVDIFIDGELRSSESGLAPFMKYDKIYAGSNGGINGGIKNVLYFNEPLSQNKIRYLGLLK